jgi:hypothetical protein
MFHSNLAIRDRTRKSAAPRIDPSAPVYQFKAEGFIGGRFVVKTIWARSDVEASSKARRSFDMSSEITMYSV